MMSQCFWILAAFFLGMAVKASNTVSLRECIRRKYPRVYRWPDCWMQPHCRLTEEQRRPVELTMAPVVTRMDQAESGDITPRRMVKQEDGAWREVPPGECWPEFRYRQL